MTTGYQLSCLRVLAQRETRDYYVKSSPEDSVKSAAVRVSESKYHYITAPSKRESLSSGKLSRISRCSFLDGVCTVRLSGWGRG